MANISVDAERMADLINDFNNNIMPWCKENELSLHKAFEISRNSEQEKYITLSELWATVVGKAYLQSVFRSHGGVLREK